MVASRAADEPARERWTTRARNATPVVLATAAVAVMPAALTFVLVHATLNASVGDFVPSLWNDQVAYWHKIGSFAEVGFDTGYYSPDEVDMPLDAVRYSVNGPWFPALYAPVAAIFGWGLATSIYVNMVVLAGGIVAFVALARLDVRQVAVTGAVVLTSWGVLLYLPTVSQESVNQALALGIAGVFVRALRHGADLSTAEKAAGVSLIVAASVFRFSWSLLLPVLFLLFARHVTANRALASVGAGVALVVLAMGLTSALQPSGHNAAIDALARLPTDPIDGTSTVLGTARANLDRFFFADSPDPAADYLNYGSPLTMTGVQSLLIVAVTVGAFGLLVSVACRLGAALETMPARESLFHVVNLGVVTIAALTLYIPHGYVRVLGAHLLVSTLVLVAGRSFIAAGVIVAASLLMLPGFVDHYERWKPNFTLERSMLERERAAFSGLVQRDPNARNAWCNTLVLPVDLFDWRITLVPFGIGISYAVTSDQPHPPRSRYVLLEQATPPFSRGLGGSHLRKLGTLETAGTLFENTASECFRSRA